MKILLLNPILAIVLALIREDYQALAAGSCAEQLAPKIGNQTIDEKIQYLEEGQSTICAQSINLAECDAAFSSMTASLKEFKGKIEKLCREQEAISRATSAGLAKGQTHFNLQSQALSSQTSHLSELRSFHEAGTSTMQRIRMETSFAVKNQITGAASSSSPPQTGDPRFMGYAEKALKATVQGQSSPDLVRKDILQMGGHGNDRAMNTLWTAANALELEKFYFAEKERMATILRGLGNTRNVASDRDTSMRSQTGSSSPLSSLLSSPALPAALMAAAQLAAAQKQAEKDEAKMPESTGASATAPTPASGNDTPPISALPTKKDEATATPPPPKPEVEKKAESPAFAYSAPGSSSALKGFDRQSSLSSAKVPVMAAARPGGQSGGAPGGGDSSADALPAAADSEKAKGPGDDFGSMGGAQSGGGGGGYGSTGSSSMGETGGKPSEPEFSGLEKILADEGASPEEVLGLNKEGSSIQSENTIFVMVHAAYVRQAKMGTLDYAKPNFELKEKVNTDGEK